MRATVNCVGQGFAHCHSDDGQEFIVAFESTPFNALQQQLRVGDGLSLIGGHEHRGVLHPSLIILEPSFMVDVTTLCGCCKSYGFNAANALLGKFETRDNTLAIQLGNLANDFFDECVHSPVPPAGRKAQFMKVVRSSFQSSPLAYTALQGIDRDFFLRADMLHGHICDTMPSLPRRLTLEPAFVCPDLGMQGRMDALSADRRCIVELKSGKCDEWRRDSKCKPEHELQMMLYCEMLHLNTGMPRHETRCLLLYCQYPLLATVRYTTLQLQQAMAVRNALVHQERLLRDGHGASLLAALKEEDFNTRGANDKFYDRYCRPVITRFMQAMKGMDTLTAAYFHAFTAFIGREQWLAKTQAYRGEALTGLRLAPLKDEAGAVVALDATLTVPTTDHDFRVGDMVVIYEDRRHQYFQAYIAHIDDSSLHLVLTHKQRDEEVFNPGAMYSLTAGYMESSFTSCYRGLAHLAQCPMQRRLELLEGTAPCQLIVGPPGTGKTSCTLRDIVREHLAQGETLLLMAYTNQAVDEICTMLAHVYPGFVRVGNENACAIPHRTRMLQHVMGQAASRADVRRLLGSIQVFVGTVNSLSSCHALFGLRSFDLTVVDEASQVLEPHIVPLLSRVGRFILIGDHKQLPAVVTQPPGQCEVTDPALLQVGLHNLAHSYFERLLRLDARSGGHRTTMLCRQGRMHEDIMSFPNRNFYGGHLTTAGLPHQHEQWEEPRVVFIDVPCRTQQALKANPAEAQVVASLVQHVMSRHQPFDPSRTLGIIVPFRAQIAATRGALIRAGLPHATSITIDTVERYQGSQRDVIIYSTTVTHPDQLDTISVVAHTDDGPVDRKLNVALTRARKQVIMVGCRRVLMRSTLYAQWIQAAQATSLTTVTATH